MENLRNVSENILLVTTPEIMEYLKDMEGEHTLHI